MELVKTQGGVALTGLNIVVKHKINDSDQNLTIRSAIFTEIQPFVKWATREKLVFAKNTSYIVVVSEGGAIIAICGLLLYSNKVVFKNDYVLPEYRGQGLWGLMFNTRRAIVSKIDGLKWIEATCTPLSLPLYLQKGFDIIEKYKTDSLSKVRIQL